MYTVCTFRLADALGLAVPAGDPAMFVYVALAAWTLTGFGLALHLMKATIKEDCPN